MAYPHLLRVAARRLLPSVLCAIPIMGQVVPAHGATIVQTDSFSLAQADITGFQEFDPSLGTLNSVSVSIAGTLSFSFLLQPQGILQPVVDFDMTGAGGRGWEFSGSGAQFVFPVAINPDPVSPAIQSRATGFSLGFILTPLTDLSGSALPTVSAGSAALVPAAAVAQRADFIEQFAPIGISETLVFTPVGFSAIGLNANGSVILTYDYTPAEVVAVATPPAGASLAVGLLALWRRGRRSAG